jgi:uncharacterized membrane protein YheB (UPF0754 family)
MHKYIFNQSAGDRAFILSNGEKINTIRELYEHLGRISEEIFFHHVNSTKNDFSKWIVDVFNETSLASRISELKNQKSIKNEIREWITDLIHEKHGVKRKEREEHLSHHHVKAPTEELKKESSHEAVDPSFSSHNETNQTIGCHPHNFLHGIIDFLLGFIVGALAMIMLLKLI